jgi:hypothetical protein
MFKLKLKNIHNGNIYYVDCKHKPTPHINNRFPSFNEMVNHENCFSTSPIQKILTPQQFTTLNSVYTYKIFNLKRESDRLSFVETLQKDTIHKLGDIIPLPKNTVCSFSRFQCSIGEKSEKENRIMKFGSEVTISLEEEDKDCSIGISTNGYFNPSYNPEQARKYIIAGEIISLWNSCLTIIKSFHNQYISLVD